jgi:hypothetical protein
MFSFSLKFWREIAHKQLADMWHSRFVRSRKTSALSLFSAWTAILAASIHPQSFLRR